MRIVGNSTFVSWKETVIIMKYLVVLCDGMADTPNAALNGKTPMECANKPNMDSLAKDAAIQDTSYIFRTGIEGPNRLVDSYQIISHCL